MTRRSFIKRFGGAVLGLAVGANLIGDRLTAKQPEFKPQHKKLGSWEQEYQFAIDALKRNIIKLSNDEMRAAWLKVAT